MEKTITQGSLDGARILQYFNLFVDGDGDIYCVACRVAHTDEMSLFYRKLYGQSIKFNSNGYMRDAVHLSKIPDIAAVVNPSDYDFIIWSGGPSTTSIITRQSCLILERRYSPESLYRLSILIFYSIFHTLLTNNY